MKRGFSLINREKPLDFDHKCRFTRKMQTISSGEGLHRQTTGGGAPSIGEISPVSLIPDNPALQVFLLFPQAQLVKIALALFLPVQSTDILPATLHLYQDKRFVCASHAVLLSWCLKLLTFFRRHLLTLACRKQECSAPNHPYLLEQPIIFRRTLLPPHSALPCHCLHSIYSIPEKNQPRKDKREKFSVDFLAT
jgi:hypothetical protein